MKVIWLIFVEDIDEVRVTTWEMNLEEFDVIIR